LPTRKRGYHGGATAQEAIVPLLVLAPLGSNVDGWREIALTPPAWWDETPTARRPEAVSRQRVRSRDGRPPQPELFPDASPAVVAAWIDALLASEVLAAQRQRAARTAVPDDRLRALLVALDQRGGVMTIAALARVLDVPAMRVGTVITAVRRLLNVDGYPVIDHDPARAEVRLDVALARTQFGLGDT
jgi:hypothetical protein